MAKKKAVKAKVDKAVIGDSNTAAIVILTNVMDRHGDDIEDIAKRIDYFVEKIEEKEDGNRTVLINNLLAEANTAMLRIAKLEQRIDRIVEAHEKCKSLKGL